MATGDTGIMLEPGEKNIQWNPSYTTLRAPRNTVVLSGHSIIETRRLLGSSAQSCKKKKKKKKKAGTDRLNDAAAQPCSSLRKVDYIILKNDS